MTSRVQTNFGDWLLNSLAKRIFCIATHRQLEVDDRVVTGCIVKDSV